MKRILFAIALIAIALHTEAKPQPVSREMYLDIMEKAVLAYTTEDIQRYSSTVDAKGVTEHGLGRLTSNIGILVSHGRIPELKEQFEHMMDLCVREMPKTSKAGNEFAIKEVVLCLQECERSGIFTREKIQAWKDGLSGARAEELYHPHKPGGKKADNWGVFGVASECARVMAGIGGDIEWAEVRSIHASDAECQRRVSIRRTKQRIPFQRIRLCSSLRVLRKLVQAEWRRSHGLALQGRSPEKRQKPRPSSLPRHSTAS